MSEDIAWCRGTNKRSRQKFWRWTRKSKYKIGTEQEYRVKGKFVSKIKINSHRVLKNLPESNHINISFNMFYFHIFFSFGCVNSKDLIFDDAKGRGNETSISDCPKGV